MGLETHTHMHIYTRAEFTWEMNFECFLFPHGRLGLAWHGSLTRGLRFFFQRWNCITPWELAISVGVLGRFNIFSGVGICHYKGVGSSSSPHTSLIQNGYILKRGPRETERERRREQEFRWPYIYFLNGWKTFTLGCMAIILHENFFKEFHLRGWAARSLFGWISIPYANAKGIPFDLVWRRRSILIDKTCTSPQCPGGQLIDWLLIHGIWVEGLK